MTKWNIEDNFARLDKMLAFERGWNGYDGLPFTPELIIRAKAILARIGKEQQPGVFPTGRNSVLMEWDSADNCFLGAEVFETGINVVYTTRYTNTDGEFEGQYEGRDNITTEEFLWSIRKFYQEHNT